MPRHRVHAGSLLLGLLLMGAAACGTASGDGGGAALSAADVAAIRSQDSAFASAANAGSAEAVAALYAPDAHLMPPNEATVTGREAIQQFWGGFLAAYRVKITVQADEIEGRGDLAFARGRYTLSGTPSGNAPPIEDKGKFLEVLRRQPDGTWRYVVDMYSSDLPAAK